MDKFTRMKFRSCCKKVIRNMVQEKPELQDQLLLRLVDVERQINDLTAQRDALRQILQDVRREELARRDVTRKNSFARISVENRILELLKAAPRSLSAEKLYRESRSIHPKLRNSTFRSYLHRLKNKGLI